MTLVRVATPADAESMFRAERLPMDELEAILRHGRLLVAEDVPPKECIGWLRWGLFWDEVPFMNRLQVAPARRREGVGRLLVSEWESACLAAGHAMVMTSTVSAESAQHFYRRLGYTDAGCLILPGESAEIFMIKKLG
jgi:GNAT superfamily N-acetyltransferase